MLKLVKCEMANSNALFFSTHYSIYHSKKASTSLPLLQKQVSVFPNHHHQNSKFSSLTTKRKSAKTRVFSVATSDKSAVTVLERENTQKSGKKKLVIIEGTVILKKTTLSKFIDDLQSSIFHLDDPLIKQTVSFQLVSAVHADPGNNLKGKLGKQSYLEEVVLNDSTSLGNGESAFRVRFDWDEEIGLPGAILVKNDHNTEFYLRSINLKGIPGHENVYFLCNSWVYPAPYYEKDRIFFTNKTYLPHQTPAPLIRYRNQELEILRGEGKEHKMLEKWDRVYDYAYYNDLGNRPIYGGTAQYPYPRRGRTSRPPTKKGAPTESRLSLLSILTGKVIYVPRDEMFNHLKLSDFLGDTFKSLFQGVVGMLASFLDFTPLEFDSFGEVLELYEGAIKLPVTPLRKRVPTQFLKALFRSDGAFFMKYPMPDIIKVNRMAWRTDEEFARQMLAGIHPLMIRRLEEFPPVSKLDPENYGNQNSSITKEHIEGHLDGLSVEEALKSNKLFILDHHDTVMPMVRKINAYTPSKVYATRTLLFLKEDGTLKPLVIELSLPHPQGDSYGAVSKVYSPSNDAVQAALWQLAKAYATVTDSAYHQLISHWLHTHAVIEPFIIASNRQLSKLHPIYKLLHPHFLDTIAVNTVARQIALNADGLFEAAVYPRQFVGEWTSTLYKDWIFTDQALPKDLIKRGMAVKDPKSPNGFKLFIEDYPYAVDGLEIWFAIETWVKEYCWFYYKSDSMVANDPELQSWWTEIREKGHGDKKNETWWPEMKTLNELTETCTTLIWVASALHAVVNFGQYPYAGYMPNRPTISRKFMPEPEAYDELKVNPDGVFLKTVTSQLRTLACLSVIELISRHSEDEVYLGHREPGWTCDTQPLEAFERFSKTLKDIEEKILQRNDDPKLKNRGQMVLPFTLLCPSSNEVGISGRGIPNSVSI